MTWVWISQNVERAAKARHFAKKHINLVYNLTNSIYIPFEHKGFENKPATKKSLTLECPSFFLDKEESQRTNHCDSTGVYNNLHIVLLDGWKIQRIGLLTI